LALAALRRWGDAALDAAALAYLKERIAITAHYLGLLAGAMPSHGQRFHLRLIRNCCIVRR